MSEYKVNGQLSKILPIESGQTKGGDEWQKITFVVTNQDGYEGREQTYAFGIFGQDKVENFLKYNKAGATVEVKFNIRTNEWKDKYYTELQAFRVESISDSVAPAPIPSLEEQEDGDLPF